MLGLTRMLLLGWEHGAGTVVNWEHVMLKKRDEVDQSNKDSSGAVAIGLFNAQKHSYEQECIFGEYT